MKTDKAKFLQMGYTEKLDFINSKQVDQKPIEELKTSSNSKTNITDHERIESLRNRIKANRKRINELNRETQSAIQTFEEVAVHCRLEWIRPKWIERPGANHLQEIIYWLR